MILDMQFPNQPLGVKWKVVKVDTVPLHGWTQVSCLYLPAEKSYYKKKDN